MKTLLRISLEALAAQIHRVRSLQGISEELALELFDEILRRAKLTPEVRGRTANIVAYPFCTYVV